MNYDPNMTMCGHMAKQTVRLTFGQWEYRKAVEVAVGGNCTGLDVIESAVGRAYEELETKVCFGNEFACITLENADGDTLLCEEEDERGEDWLKDMLIAAEIIAIEPNGRLW